MLPSYSYLRYYLSKGPKTREGRRRALQAFLDATRAPPPEQKPKRDAKLKYFRWR